MSNYKIITDATADLPQELVEKHEIYVIPMECSLDGTTYEFEPTAKQIHPKAYYEKMREDATTSTSQINVFTYANFFAPILEAGDDILYIAFSSALTGSQQSAAIAIAELLKKYPERQILMVDSLAASLGEGLLVYAAVKKKEEGLELSALAKWVEDYRNKLSHWFTVDDLKYLKRGGRLSAASALIGTALRIKPVLHVDDLGRLVALDKVPGRKRSLKALVEFMKETYTPEVFPDVFLGHADCEEDAKFVADYIKETIGADVNVINYISPVIGAHSGPGTVALFHFGTHK
ncbi:DegV family protein [Christensenellaceae bacterium OttesenSCG-928-M15]|nr:DegV family protein [Christensenellaceae bacterium OttesenSCG-928-M15]